MIIDGFDDLRRLGGGAVGDVYVATRASAGSRVAIKVMRHWSEDSAAWVHARADLTAVLALRGHPHIVHVEEVIQADGLLAVVMEYLPGGSVIDFVSARGQPLTVAEGLLVAAHGASALASAGDRGLVHGGINPRNLLINSFGQVKVADFGLATLGRSSKVVEQTLANSLSYTSPELIADRSCASSSADVYALAATLHHGVTGRQLQVIGVEYPNALAGWRPPPDIPADIVEGFRDLLQSCLDLEPDRRPSATQVERAVEQIAGAFGPSAVGALAVSIARDLPSRGTPGARTSDTIARPVAEPTVQRPAAEPTVQRRAGVAADRPLHDSVVHPSHVSPAGNPPVPPGGYVTGQPEPAKRSIAVPLTVVASALALLAAALALVLARDGTDGAEPPAEAIEDRAGEPSSDLEAAAEQVESGETVGAATEAGDSDDAVVETTSTTTSSTTTTTSTTTTVAPTTTLDPETAAKGRLDELVTGDRGTMFTLAGSFVPQLSVKQYDWQEPTTREWYLWEQILADHMEFRNRPHGSVVLAAPFEFSTSDNPWWFTLVDAPRSSRDGVRSWCESNGYAWGVTCIARKVDKTP